MSNEAAERLLVLLTQKSGPYKDAPVLHSAIRNGLADALAAERRATVERIRAALTELRGEHQPGGLLHANSCAEVIARDLDAILDAESL